MMIPTNPLSAYIDGDPCAIPLYIASSEKPASLEGKVRSESSRSQFCRKVGRSAAYLAAAATIGTVVGLGSYSISSDIPMNRTTPKIFISKTINPNNTELQVIGIDWDASLYDRLFSDYYDTEENSHWDVLAVTNHNTYESDPLEALKTGYGYPVTMYVQSAFFDNEHKMNKLREFIPALSQYTIKEMNPDMATFVFTDSMSIFQNKK